ncbi:hypothetical protein SteCoe_27875 [Stentor coeruleus]|uniref:non-specific serine/threonine protein kinase n=1 Tax=Stentor coeruleus TaxID=5963 RepID=A0A1R2B9I8_9CILI|nr:hypothetical protein SteCoe_27875 [Stentor coeruleus]
MGSFCSNPEVLPGKYSGQNSLSKRSLSKVISKRQANPKTLYKNLKMIGKGTYSSVYLVENKKTSAKRAMKEIRKSALKENAQETIYNEIIILSQLDHPNIVKIFEVIDSPSFFYIISEYLEGGELFQRLTESDHINESLVCRYMYDTTSAIYYCHSKGVIHKDLKPENLMFDVTGQDSTLKIIDFGTSARLTGIQGDTIPAVGTIYYLSPEQIKGHVSEKSDIWSLGIIMYMTLCNFYSAGKLPFYGKSFDETVDNILNTDISFIGEVWNNISNAAQNLIEALLDKDPEKRPSADKILMHPWFKDYSSIAISKTSSSLQALKNLSEFKSESKVIKYLFMVIACQHSEIANNYELMNLFKALDKDRDGKLNQQEILDGLLEFGFHNNIEEIMEQIDINMNGFVEYSEFLVATQDWKKLIARKNIFDILKSETLENNLNMYDIKAALPMLDISEVHDFVNEIDMDGDGKITIEDMKRFFLDNLG